MIQAEILREEQRPDFNGHQVSVAYIETEHGIHTVKSTVPKGAGLEVVVAGGFLSGGGYDNLVEESVGRGFICRTVRHGNNRFRGAIEADADELAASIELLCGDRPVHILAHSMGGRVAYKAATRLDPSIRLVRMTFSASAWERSSFTTLTSKAAGIAIEHAFCTGRMKGAAKGFVHQVTHRGIGLAGEAYDLFTHHEGDADQIRELQARGVYLVNAHGSYDHLVPDSSTKAAMSRLDFDEERHTHGVLDGGHNAMLTSKAYIGWLLDHSAA